MTRRNQIKPLKLALLLLFFGSSISLSACQNNSQPDNQASNQQPATQTTTEQTNSTTGSNTGAVKTGSDPVTAAAKLEDRPATDPLQLVQTQQIKTELGLTDDQTAKLKQIEADFRKEVDNITAGVKLEGLSEQQQEAKLKEVSQQIDKQAQATRQKVGTVLKPEQVTRMRQIFLQIYGFGPLTKDDFVTDLKLTDAQQQQLNDIRDKMLKNIKANWQNVSATATKAEQNKTIASNRQKAEQIIKQSNDQALAVLTPQQKQSLEALKGKKFNLDPKQLAPS